MRNPICIYHGNCADGFTAAWAVWKRYGDNIDYYAATHGDPPPDVSGRDVFMVDFSYKRDVILKLAEQARSIVILDHHASAERELEQFIAGGNGTVTINDVFRVFADLREIEMPPVVALFDMERSGAGMTWDFSTQASRGPSYSTTSKTVTCGVSRCSGREQYRPPSSRTRISSTCGMS